MRAAGDQNAPKPSLAYGALPSAQPSETNGESSNNKEAPASSTHTGAAVQQDHPNSSEDVVQLMGRVVDTTKTGIVSDPKYKHRRHWLPRSANIAPDPDGQTRLEGVVLVDAEDQDILSQGGKIGWERVKAVMVCEDEEANSETKGQSRLFRLIRTVFHTQPTRRFVTGILQRGYTMSVFCMDRTGGGSSESFDVNEKPALFLKAICWLMMSPEDYIGCGFETQSLSQRARLPKEIAEITSRGLDMFMNKMPKRTYV